MIRRSVLIAAFALVAGAAAPAVPAAAAADPGEVVTQLGHQGLAALGPQVPPAQRLARFRELFRQNFDLQSIGRFVLGRYWRMASPGEQQEFHKLFTDYITMVYSNRLSEYAGAQLRVTGARPEADGALVISELTNPKGGQPVKIEWRMTRFDDTYKVSDVIIDGVSMAATQRSEFASVIQRHGGTVEGLLASLREKVGSGGQTQSVAAPARPQPALPQAGMSRGTGYGSSIPSTPERADFGTSAPSALTPDTAPPPPVGR